MTAKKSAGPIVGVVLVILVAVGGAFWGITTRARALAVVTRETRELAVPTVAVAMPDRGSPQEEIVLPGNMQAFADASIYARTNGYLKRWYVDIGAHVRAGQTLAEIDTLIDSGSNARELFHVAAVQTLRVFVNVPEVYARAAQPGLKADLTLKEYPGRRFTGTLVRTAQAIEVASRTLLTEIDVDNPHGELLPGSYAEVHLHLPTAASTLKVPVSALIFRSDGLMVATIKEGNQVAIVPVIAGRDFGNAVEILGGLTGSERVILNPPDSLADGETVRIVAAAAPQQR